MYKKKRTSKLTCVFSNSAGTEKRESSDNFKVAVSYCEYTNKTH